MEVMVVVGRSGNLMILDCDVLLQNIKLSEYRGLTSSYNFSFFHNSTPRESSLQTANFTETTKSYSPKTHHISQVALLEKYVQWTTSSSIRLSGQTGDESVFLVIHCLNQI